MSGVSDHLLVVNDTVGPQPWMQLREVASARSDSVARTYDPNNATAKNDVLQTLTLQWTNNSPVTQVVYGLLTRGGVQVSLQCRSRGYIRTSHGVSVGTSNPTMIEVSRCGTGGNTGLAGILSFNPGYAVAELRTNSITMPLMPGTSGQWSVASGQTIYASVELRFVSEFWESNTIDGGDIGTEAKVVSGDSLLQFMATPSLTTPAAVGVPTLVGGTANITTSRQTTTGITLTKPTGVVAGDRLIAIVANQWAFMDNIQPTNSSWRLVHGRDGGWLDVHMKIYTRTVDASDPASYTFSNGALSEETGVLFALRGAAAYDPTYGGNWQVGSNLSKWKLYEEHKAPSIKRSGQLLICTSYFAHFFTQGAINQTPPDGMTSWFATTSNISSLAVAALASPPNPTGGRRFTPSRNPLFSGHAIAAAILIPGV